MTHDNNHPIPFPTLPRKMKAGEQKWREERDAVFRYRKRMQVLERKHAEEPGRDMGAGEMNFHGDFGDGLWYLFLVTCICSNAMYSSIWDVRLVFSLG